MKLSFRATVFASVLCVIQATTLANALTTAERATFYPATPDKWSLEDNLDPLPGWPYTPMVQELLKDLQRDHIVKKIRVRLLTWSTQEDNRPLLVDSAVLWATFESAHGQRWVLSHRFRHPRVRPNWWDATPTDVEWRCTIVLDRPPKNSDVYALLEHEGHPQQFFGPLDPGFTVLMSGVRASTWRAVIGEAPTEFFK